MKFGIILALVLNSVSARHYLGRKSNVGLQFIQNGLEQELEEEEGPKHFGVRYSEFSPVTTWHEPTPAGVRFVQDLIHQNDIDRVLGYKDDIAEVHDEQALYDQASHT